MIGNRKSQVPKENLTVSDWVAFLTGVKYGNLGTVLNFAAILVILVTTGLIIRTNLIWFTILDVLIVSGFIYYSFSLVFNPFGKQGAIAEMLLNKITSGEFKSEIEIRNAWNVEMAQFKSRSKTRGFSNFRLGGFLMIKKWVVILIVIFLAIVGLALWVQSAMTTNKDAAWFYAFFIDWENVLSAAATLLLVIAAFWVIYDTRYFRYLDDKTKTISGLARWGSKTFKNIVTLSHDSADLVEFKKNYSMTRADLMVRVAESITTFAQAHKLLATIKSDNAKQAEKLINYVDIELRQHITDLWEFDIDHADVEKINALSEKAGSLTGHLRQLLENIGEL